MATLYAALYILMEPVAGLSAAPLIVGGTVFSNKLLDQYGATANMAAIFIHVTSWILQFIGHGVYEGRAPALFDNLIQALFLAPFFVWFEILFFLGYRPELRKRLDVAIEEEIKKFNKGQSTRDSVVSKNGMNSR